MHQAVFNEMIGDVHVVFVNCHFEGQLVQFESVKRIVCRQSCVTLSVSENDLDVGGGQRHVVGPLQDHFEHVFVVVAHAVVQVEKCLVGIVLKLAWQRLHLVHRE